MLTLFSRKLRAPPMSVSFASVISTHSRKIPTACHFWGEHTGTDHRGHKLVIKHLWYCTPQCPVPGVSLGVTWESQQNMEDKVVRDNMQIRSALDGPPCSATAHNFKNSHQVPWCYLTQCKGDDHSWFGEKKKVQKPQQDKSEKEHLPDHDGGASSRTDCDVSCEKQAGSPKNFHQQASLFL